jgi:hypothetical protein
VAIVENGRDKLVKAHEFSAVWMGDTTRIGQSSHHNKAKIDEQLTRRTV